MLDSKASAIPKVIAALAAAREPDRSLRWEDDSGGDINTVDAENTCEK
jgi:hypothetical protein